MADEKDTAMEELFGEEQPKTEVLVPVVEADDDYEYVRQHIRNVMDKGNIAMTELLEIARDSGHPRAFEVLSTLMSTVVTAGKDLMDAKETAQMIEQRKEGGGKQVNNNLIITTAELQKLLAAAKE